jgi:soluble lytic murein transglycosylase-like protein
MSQIQKILLLAVFAAILAASSALAAELPAAESSMPAASSATAPVATAAVPAPAPAPAPSGVQEGSSLNAAPAPTPEAPASPPPSHKAPSSSGGGSSGGSGGTAAGGGSTEEAASPTIEEPEVETGGSEEVNFPAPGSEPFEIPSIPSSSCASAGVPPVLIPIYQRAAATYGLGPQGPAVLAGINEIETAFGSNLNVSSAGAQGWMQFIPSTWDMYGVDANGDGVRDPYNPEDAINAAANYLSAAGMPTDTYGAIFSYNHADWYVEEVLANAACYSGIGSGSVVGGFALTPQLEVLACNPSDDWRGQIPADYMKAFESAAARYELGEQGVWALASVARLESNFGRGMPKGQLHRTGPLGLDSTEWLTFAVDGDEDGHIRHGDIDDSAATLARMIWSRGSLRAGIFTHNQAQWYVQAVLADAEELEGGCKTTSVDWAVSMPGTSSLQINWANLTLSNELELNDLQSGAIDPRIVGLIAAITQEHQLTISALRSDHSEMTASGNVSNHFFGRAMDIASVDGVSCTDTAVDAPCAKLARTLAYLPAPAHPTELIYCFDVDGPGEAFALPDHCDHVHAGYDG